MRSSTPLTQSLTRYSAMYYVTGAPGLHNYHHPGAKCYVTRGKDSMQDGRYTKHLCVLPHSQHRPKQTRQSPKDQSNSSILLTHEAPHSMLFIATQPHGRSSASPIPAT
jgi:hypothetical protein